MKNNIFIVVIISVVVGVGSFFGGMQYQKKQIPQFGNRQIGGQMRTGNGGQVRNAVGAQPVSGEIISKDDTGITVKMDDGSTKIIIVSDTTSINKTDKASIDDLKEGDKVTAFGTTNSDGTITAQSVAIGGMFFGRVDAGAPDQDNSN